MLALPLQRALLEFLQRKFQTALLYQRLDYTQVLLLIRGHEGDTQGETMGQRVLLVHGIAPVHIFRRLAAIAKVLANEVQAI